MKNPITFIKRKMRNYFIMRLVKRARRFREFHRLIADILDNAQVQKMRNYNHHSNVSCYEHSMHVAYWNYKICSLLGWDKRAGARAGMLHDLFLYDWHQYKADSFKKLHGFTHPKLALENARRYFDLTGREEDIIVKHMFPLTLALPKYRETYVIVLTDKICAFSEVIRGLVHSKPYVCKSLKY